MLAASESMDELTARPGGSWVLALPLETAWQLWPSPRPDTSLLSLVSGQGEMTNEMQ